MPLIDVAETRITYTPLYIGQRFGHVDLCSEVHLSPTGQRVPQIEG